MHENKLNMQIYKPFGPPIGILKMPDSLIAEINNYVNNLGQQKSKELDHGESLVGNVTQEIFLEKNFVEKNLLNFIGQATEKYVKAYYGIDIKKFNLLKAWVVRQFKNDYNPIHWHGGHISGVGYLKVPKNLGGFIQKSKDANKSRNGNLVLSHGAKMFMSNSIMQIKPEVGKFILFPHYLMHSVYPFRDTDEERRSISFNCQIDDDIYDRVYGGDL